MYSNDDEEFPEPLIGIESGAWMARVVAYLAPKNMMYRGFDGMITYLQTTEHPSTYEMLDHFVQCTVNGEWQDPYPEAEAEPPAISEEDIQAFRDMLNGEGGDDD